MNLVEDSISARIKVYIDRIVYPGYGLSDSEKSDLQSAVESFSQNAKLVSFEEAV